MNLSEAFTQIGQWFADLAARAVPPGGITGQVLKKASNDDFDTAWGSAGLQIYDPGSATLIPVTNLTIQPCSVSSEGTSVTVNIATPPARTNYPPTVLDRYSKTVNAVSVDSDDPIEVELEAMNFAAFPSLTQVGAGQGRFVSEVPFITTDTAVTSGTGATIEARQLFAGYGVFGQMADVGSVAPFFYSGLKVSVMSGLDGNTDGNYGELARYASGPTNQIVPTLRPLGSEVTYAEFTLGGTAARAGLSMGWVFGDATQLGETGTAVSFGLQVDPGDLTHLLVYSESVLLATLVGTGDLTTQRLGILLDPAAQEFWIAADGVWLTLVPGTDPGVSFAAIVVSPHFAVSPAVDEPVNFYWRPGLISYATEATTAGAARIGWGAP